MRNRPSLTWQRERRLRWRKGQNQTAVGAGETAQRAQSPSGLVGGNQGGVTGAAAEGDFRELKSGRM